ILYCLAAPDKQREHALIIDRVITDDVHPTARSFKAALDGTGDVCDRHGHPDPGRSRFLRDRLALYQGDREDLVVQFAVCYRERLPNRRDEQPARVTDAMLMRVRKRLLDEGWGGFRWHIATTASELPP